MGRRIEMRTLKDGSDLLQRFIYDNYLCIQQLRSTDNTLIQSYIWDPTEPIATRPLIFIPSIGEVAYYFHDGNKNVSDLIPTSGILIHYAYTPFGTPTASVPSENPFGFSSEFYDGLLGLVYYNYRHYMPFNGRWCGRDAIFELGSINLYSIENPFLVDFIGLSQVRVLNKYIDVYTVKRSQCKNINGCYQWDDEMLPNLTLEYTQTVIAELVWSSRERWKAFLETCGEEFIPSLDEFVKGQLTDSTMKMLAQKIPGIDLGMSFMDVIGVFQNTYNVTIGTLVPPSGSQQLFHDGDYYKIVDAIPIDRTVPLGFDSTTSHIISEPCTSAIEGKIYMTAKLVETKMKEEGQWENENNDRLHRIINMDEHLCTRE